MLFTLKHNPMIKMHMSLTFSIFLLLQTAAVLCEFPTSYRLERAFPVNHTIEMSKLRERDFFRHRRILQQSGGGGDVVDFPVEGTYDPYRVG